ncbi:MAG TPA: TolC family protein [Bacteroidia bacterium]|nr:TolC family protein [Bacteroidia bacterium]
MKLRKSVFKSPTKNYFLALIGIFFGTVVLAQQTQQISLADAVQLGIKNSNQLKLAQAKVAVAVAKANEDKDYTLPNAKLGASYARYDVVSPFQLITSGSSTPLFALNPQVFSSYMGSASVSEGLFNGFKLKYLRQSADYLQQAAKADVDKDKNDLIFSIVEAYYNIYKMESTKKLIAQSLDQTAQHVKEVQDFLNQGLATSNDLLKVELQQSDIQLSEMDVENSLKIIRYNFNLMIGLPDSTNIVIDTNIIASAKTISPFATCLQNAIDGRSELKSAALQMQAAQANIGMIKSDYYPAVGVGLGYNYINPTSDFVPPTDQFISAWNVGLNVSYNLASLYTTKNKLDEAKAQIDALQAGQDELSNSIKMEVNASFVEYQQTQEKINVLEKSVAQAVENDRIVKSKFDNHIALLSDLLDADVALYQTKIALTNEQADAEIAYNKLLKSIGKTK